MVHLLRYRTLMITILVCKTGTWKWIFFLEISGAISKITDPVLGLVHIWVHFHWQFDMAMIILISICFQLTKSVCLKNHWILGLYVLILTLKCKRGGPLGSMILFFAYPVKTRKDFSALFWWLPNSWLRIFWWKKIGYRLRHFQANLHKWALLRNISKLEKM